MNFAETSAALRCGGSFIASLDSAQIAAGHEMLAVGSKQHAAHFGIGVDVFEEFGNGRQPSRVQGVCLVGLVESKSSDGSGGLENDVCHCLPPSEAVRIQTYIRI
jgi:hypothetical protein